MSGATKNDKTKLWIVSELFYPEESSTSYILTQIAEYMSYRRNVHVICGPKHYESEVSLAIEDNSLKHVTIHRIPFFNLDKNVLWKRSIRMFGLSIMFCFSFLFKARKNEKVLIVTNPALLLVFFSWIAKLKRSNLCVLVHDIFPENALSANLVKNPTSFSYRFSKRIFDKAYSRANTLIAIGDDMSQVLQKKVVPYRKQPDCPQIIVIPNWSDENIRPLPQKDTKLEEWGLSGKFVFLFAGNMGRVQGLDKLSDIISKVNNPYIHFVFLGGGSYKEALKHKTKHLSNVTIGDAYSRNQQNIILNSCHAAIVSLSPNMYGLGVPSKFYNILAAGKPTLYVGDFQSEIDRCIQTYQIGWTFYGYDGSLLSFFNQITSEKISVAAEMGVKARKCAEDLFSRSKIMSQFEMIL